jgi:hypothetical protein
LSFRKERSLFSYNNTLDTLVVLKPNFDYKFSTNYFTKFSIYNRNTKLNDIYFFSRDTIYYVKSEDINTNQFMYRDSFNPNAAGDFGTGLILGSLNMVFNTVFK